MQYDPGAFHRGPSPKIAARYIEPRILFHNRDALRKQPLDRLAVGHRNAWRRPLSSSAVRCCLPRIALRDGFLHRLFNLPRKIGLQFGSDIATSGAGAREALGASPIAETMIAADSMAAEANPSRGADPQNARHHRNSAEGSYTRSETNPIRCGISSSATSAAPPRSTAAAPTPRGSPRRSCCAVPLSADPPRPGPAGIGAACGRISHVR